MGKRRKKPLRVRILRYPQFYRTAQGVHEWGREWLLKDAHMACGADTETVRLGLEALRRSAYQRLRAFGGTEPDSPEPPRRREKPAGGRRVA